jgi:hypothetical protein
MIDRTLSEARRVATELSLAGVDDKQLAICKATTRGRLARLPNDAHWSEEPANFTVVPRAAGAWRSPPACCRQRSAWTRAARSQQRFNVRDHGTCGLISRHTVFPLATSLDHGPMT